MLPHVVFELIRVRQLLDEVLDRVLPETEEVRPRNTITVLPIPDVICCTDNRRPCAGCGPSNHRPIGVITGDDLELGTIAAIEDRTVIHSFNIGIDS